MNLLQHWYFSIRANIKDVNVRTNENITSGSRARNDCACCLIISQLKFKGVVLLEIWMTAAKQKQLNAWELKSIFILEHYLRQCITNIISKWLIGSCHHEFNLKASVQTYSKLICVSLSQVRNFLKILFTRKNNSWKIFFAIKTGNFYVCAIKQLSAYKMNQIRPIQHQFIAIVQLRELIITRKYFAEMRFIVFVNFAVLLLISMACWDQNGPRVYVNEDRLTSHH